MRKLAYLLGLVWLVMSCNSEPKNNTSTAQKLAQIEFQIPENLLENMKIYVPNSANRAVSFTNKEAGFYYTQTHENNHPEHAHFEGFNLAKKRIFLGYELFAEDKKLDSKNAEVWVYPHKMLRKYGKITEELYLVDYKNAIEVKISGAKEKIGIRLKGENIKHIESEENMVFLSSEEGNKTLIISTKNNATLNIQEDKIYAKGSENSFLIGIAENQNEAKNLILDIQQNLEKYKIERQNRIENLLLKNTFLQSDNDSLVLALNWIQTTMNQLVTRQQGDGIYAGVPWFNEYWGRDEFIAMPGACLVSGEFETAKNILKSFAKFQNMDENSTYFGRVPNILNPELIDYHTTDGTPRFIIQLQEYVKYSGDSTLISELYPNVKNSIDGAIKFWTNEKGYLLHEDNETWMDARDKNLVPFTPRGSQANDIQALWYKQLQAGLYFAKYMKDAESEKKWHSFAQKVKENFAKDYQNPDKDFLADRLTKENEADFTLRPNQLFCYEMLDNEAFKAKITKICWEELVYPWGVASLNRQDKNFHPFHLTKHYHKDYAYHRGTVWLWNNGIAMQRMIEAGKTEKAYELFKNMNRDALTRGVVGGLAENADAYPHEGQKVAKLTGTYLQAWSNAEHLRVWYQYFLGIRPDMTHQILTLAPRLPKDFDALKYQVIIGNGLVKGEFDRKNLTYRYEFENISVTTEIDIFPYKIQNISVKSGNILELREFDNYLEIKVLSQTGKELNSLTAERSKTRLELRQKQAKILENVSFCQPLDLENHKVLNLKK